MYVCVHVCIYIYIYIYICIHIHVRIQVNRHKKIIYMYCRYTQREVRKAVKSALALCNYAELTVHANCHRRRESGKMPSMRTSFARMYIYIYIYTHTHTWRSPRETRETSGLDISFGISSPLVSRVWFFRMKSCTTEAAFARQRSNGRDGFLRLANESRCMRVFATIKTINQIVETQERKQNSQIRWKTQKIKKNSKIKGKKWRVALIGDWGEKRKKKKKNGGK